ncbi:tetratricopeptide repeat protein [Chitinophaga filiformis]|uniref:Tetratricopeptide repeat-containing protein n=1 Tax=Chitinophaga filiformis TaxID=104663 RepID=A0A1G7UIX1_CHIFI|nr:tetratricopeptide repeat protein [Chitinophaga filiformis]SDG47201.1 Tetratricopeptide repeat-containing protein [Chitinophaga filiformis]
MLVMRSLLLLLFSGLLSGGLFAQNDKLSKLQLPDQDDYRQVKPDSTFLELKDAYNRAVEKKEPLAAASCLAQMGQICLHLGHFPQALDYHLQAGDIFRKEGAQPQLAANLNDIGMLYYYNKQPELSRQQYEEALAIFRQLSDKTGIALTYGKIGHLYEKQQRYDSAFAYQRRALAAYLSADDKPGMSKIYENIGSIYEDLARYDSASYYFNRALDLSIQGGEKLNRIEILNNLGDVYRKTGQYPEALFQTRRALLLALELREQRQLSGAYRDLAKAHHLAGNNDSAFYYLEMSRQYLLGTYSDENAKQVALLQTVYDIEKKNNEIERLQNARRTNRIITAAIIVVILLLVAMSVLIISRQRLKLRNEQILRQQHRQIFETEKELMEAALQNKHLQEGKLKEELEVRSRELTTHTLHLIQKNQLLEELRLRLDEMVKDDKRDQKKQLKQLLGQINYSFNHDQYWVDFRNIFEQVHQTFFDNLKKYCDTLTSNDLRVVALLKMNMESQDIATLLGISQDSLRVVRYRLRKKLNLQQGESLTAFIQSL